MRIIILLLVSVLTLSSHAQNSLEGIEVEIFYISSQEDNLDSLHSGTLTPGSVTYRIYVDLAAKCRLQAVYGAPNHTLSIKSSALIYNHTEAGNDNANIIRERELPKNIALLDSWISIGAAGENMLAIPKEIDNEGNDEIIFKKGFLSNECNAMGIPLTRRNGMVRSEYLAFPTYYHLEESIGVLEAGTKSNEFRVENGAWAALGKGAVGADSLAQNRVCIAQITTNGSLDYELNLLINSPEGKSQKYVARNAAEPNEFVAPCLIGHIDMPICPTKKSHRKSKHKKNKNHQR
jgi:hypothetical protein